MKEFIIKYKTEEKCDVCKKEIVPEKIIINRYWGTEQQIEEQGGTVGKFLEHVCKDCVNKGKGIFFCNECEKEYPMKDLKFTSWERYAEEEKKTCINCYNKMNAKTLIKRMFEDDFEVKWMRG